MSLLAHMRCTSRCPIAGAAGLDASALEKQLRRALYLASRSTDKRVASAASASYVFLQRAAAGSPAADCRAKVSCSACWSLQNT